MLDPSLHCRYLFRRTDVTAPSLGLAQSFWALGQREISLVKSLEQACAGGFQYFEVGLREDRLAETARLLKAFPLKLIAQGWATTAGEARVYMKRAVELGAVAINVHLGHAYLTADEAALMVDDMNRMADAYRLPLLLETHRGRVTQDLFRTTDPSGTEIFSRAEETRATTEIVLRAWSAAWAKHQLSHQVSHS